MSEPIDTLDDEDRQALMMACAEGLSLEHEVFTEEELLAAASKACEWAHGVRLNEALLRLVLDGRVGLRFKGDEPLFFRKAGT